MKDDNGKPTAVETAPTCQVCGEPLRGRAVILCRSCRTAHHLECWRFNKGCSMYGCGSRISMKPPTELELSDERSFSIDAGQLEDSNVTLPGVVVVIGSFGLIGLVSLLFSNPAIWAFMLSVGWFVILLLWGILLSMLSYRLQVSVDEGSISCTSMLLGSEVRSCHLITALEIVELHLHHVPKTNEFGSTRIRTNIKALTTDGCLLPLYSKESDPAIDNTDEASRIADRLASFADCTVREFERNAQPTPDEIAQALTEYRAQHVPALDVRTPGCPR